MSKFKVGDRVIATEDNTMCVPPNSPATVYSIHEYDACKIVLDCDKNLPHGEFIYYWACLEELLSMNGIERAKKIIQKEKKGV